MSSDSQSSELLHTPLTAWHQRHGARLVDFAGWLMPVQYESIVDEHLATRQQAGLFDISHMGRIWLEGPDAAAFLDRILTRRVVGLKTNAVRYSLIVNDAGGVLDDVLVYRLADAAGKSFHLLVVNASNRERIFALLERHLADAPAEVKLDDRTPETAMIAVQGPHAISLTSHLVDLPLADLAYYTGAAANVCGQPGFVSRTGYTGEDGCELIVEREHATQVWETLLQDSSHGAQPVGLGARDTLRLEAGMPLYGHELSETINPFEAGLGFAVHLRDREFLGSTALRRIKAEPQTRVRIGLRIDGRRPAREEYPVLAGDESIGITTSGTFSPSLQCPIAMAYVPPEYAEVGTRLLVDVRGKPVAGEVVALPFYRRPES